jgi:hypothetical protein
MGQKLWYFSLESKGWPYSILLNAKSFNLKSYGHVLVRVAEIVTQRRDRKVGYGEEESPNYCGH